MNKKNNKTKTQEHLLYVKFDIISSEYYKL